MSDRQLTGLTNEELALLLKVRAKKLSSFLITMHQANPMELFIKAYPLDPLLELLKEVEQRNSAVKPPAHESTVDGNLRAVKKLTDKADLRVCKTCALPFEYKGGVDDSLCGTCATRQYGDK